MKFYGKVGYLLEPVEEEGEREGNWVDKIEERNYYGDVLRNTRRWEGNSDSINDDLKLNNTISILADGFAYENCGRMKYVNWMGTLWKITNVEIQRPRLILMIGGVYNGPTA